MSGEGPSSAGAGGEPWAAHSSRPWFLHRTVLFAAILAALAAGWFAYASASARAKLDPALATAIAMRQPVNLWVELPFPPEEFHIRYLQDRGTVTGVQGRWIHLVRVRPAAAWSIARLYWVRRIRSEPEPQGAGRTRVRTKEGAYAVLPV